MPDHVDRRKQIDRQAIVIPAGKLPDVGCGRGNPLHRLERARGIGIARNDLAGDDRAEADERDTRRSRAHERTETAPGLATPRAALWARTFNCQWN